MISFFKKISNFENHMVNAVQWIAAVTILVFLKTLLSAVASGDATVLSGDIIGFLFLREWSFYSALLLTELLLLSVLVKETIERLGAFLLIALGASFIPYCIGLFGVLGNVQGSFEGARVPFLYGFRDIWAYAGEFFGSMSLVQYAEFGIGALLLGVFIFLKTRSVVKVVVGGVAFVVSLFCIHALPYVVAWMVGSTVFHSYGDGLSYLHGGVVNASLVFSLFYGVLIVVQASLVYYLYSRLKFLAVVHNTIRFPRLVTNIAALSLGFMVALREYPIIQLTLIDWCVIALAYSSLILYWAWAVHNNDLDDQHGDAVAMKHRPIQQGITTHEDVRVLNSILLFGSLITAFVVGYGFLLFMLVRVGVGYFYSSEPFRLKRFPIISNITLGLAYLSTVLAGYMIVADHTILTFSWKLAVFVFLSYVLCSEFKGLRTHEGDMADGVATIPTVFGIARGKTIVGAMGFVGFLIAPIIYMDAFIVLIVPSLVAGAWYYWTITHEHYEEDEVYAIYFAFAVYLGVLYSLQLLVL